ncbi:MAG: hypothetical protein SH868_08190 [Bythopirellula sp.]|nr:hypothetical protein [Bythopirellula sp.]
MRFCVSLLCAVTASWGLSAAALSRELALASLVPDNAIACLTTPDLAQLDSQWTATGFYRLWQDDALRNFQTSFHQASRLSPDVEQSLLGVSRQQLLEVASGEVCLALIPVGERDTGFLLLVDVSRHKAEAAQIEAELRLRSSTTAGMVRNCFLEEGVLGITNRKELAGEALERLKNPSDESLLASSAYQIVAEQSHAAAGSAPVQLNWFIDPWAFQKLLTRASPASASNSWNQLAAAGFQVIRAAGGMMRFATTEHDMEHHWFIYAPGEREKAARLLDFKPLDAWELPAWIPANVDSVVEVHWNLAGALTGYGSLFDAAYAEGIEGTFEAVLDDIYQEPDGPQVDIPALTKLQTGPVLCLSKTSADRGTAIVYAVKVNDEPQIANALQRMFETDEGVHRKSIGKFDIWVFAGTSADEDESDAPTMGPDLAGYALCAAQDYLYVSTSATALEKLLSEPMPPELIEDKMFLALQTQAVAQRTMDSIGWRVTPLAAGLRPLYQDLRATGIVDLGQVLGDASSDARQVDFSLLPAGEVLPKFIGAGWGLVDQLEDGWLMRGSVLKHVE